MCRNRLQKSSYNLKWDIIIHSGSQEHELLLHKYKLWNVSSTSYVIAAAHFIHSTVTVKRGKKSITILYSLIKCEKQRYTETCKCFADPKKWHTRFDSSLWKECFLHCCSDFPPHRSSHTGHLPHTSLWLHLNRAGQEGILDSNL